MEWKLEKYSRSKVKPEKDVLLASTINKLSKAFLVGLKRQYPFSVRTEKGAADSPESPCSRCKGSRHRWFPHEIPSATSPVTTSWRHCSTTEYDDVCQRLSLDSPPHVAENYQLSLPAQETCTLQDMEQEPGREDAGNIVSAPFGKSQECRQARIDGIKSAEEVCIWKECERSEAPRSQVQPFSVLETAPSMPRSHFELELRLAVPGMQDDYYLNLLAWSEQNLVALGLGSAVYVWNAEIQALQGSLHIRPPATLVSFTSSLSSWSSVSSVAWSKDGHILAIGKHDGEIQLWDVEYKRNIRNVTGHLSLVGSLSFNQHILSSGSFLGFIHHHDIRATRPMVGWIQQQKSICGLQWCPDGSKLSSGTSDGLLSIWPNDPGATQKCLPLLTRQHLTAVKALCWCPWQLELLAVGGGRQDKTLRIWDTHTGVCLQSAQSNSQVCSLCFLPRSQEILTGHSLPHCHVSSWKVPTLTQLAELHGHKGRVLHITPSPCGTRVFTAGSDHQACVWKLLDEFNESLQETE